MASINLVKEREKSLLDRFINWALTIGRVVVILIELTALLAFLYRFSLDRRIIDLHSKIKQEEAIVRYLSNNELTYRNLQDRLLIASSFATVGEQKVKLFKDIFGLAPKDITFNNVSIFEDRLKIDANLGSVSSLRKFVESLKSYPGITSISIDQIENKPTSALITVVISASFEKEKSQNATK